MTITGRITADAILTTLDDERKVVNFSVAVNDRYKKKDGEVVKVTSFYNCSFWLSEKLAEHLKKGTLVEAEGRVYATPYVSKDGTAKASLNCHVRSIKILAWPREVEVIGQPATTAQNSDAAGEDVPF